MNPTFITPIRFDGRGTADSVGMSQAGVRRIEEVFEEQLDRGLHPGAQLVVLRHGQVVVDLAAGLADVRRKIPVTHDTPFLTWSCTKPFTGMCVHRLIEEGKVEWDAPVARYWPEFGCKGKESATIRHVFLHQAGIPRRGIYTQFLLWSNWERVTRNVAGLPAEFPPGSRTAYHLVNYGFILGEVVRRVTGQPIQDYLRQTFLEPLGMRNSWLGLPANERPRAARLYCDPSQRLAVLAFRWWRVRGAVMPAATLHSTARDLAIFYQMLLNGGLYASRRYVQPETIAAATTLGYEGYDETLGLHVRWAHGFELGGDIPANGSAMGREASCKGKGSTPRTFGHNGQASCMTWADPDAGVVVAFVCNRLLNDADSLARWKAISDAVWDALE